MSDRGTLSLSDDDKGTVTASFGGQIVRTWNYDTNPRHQMRLAREFAEGWYQALLHRNKRASN